MKDRSRNPSLSTEQSYLEQVEALRQEMGNAMLAISGNSLQALQKSLWQQQVLCISLKHLLGQLQEVDSTASSRIRSATTALHHVNLTYAGLVHQSRTAADLMFGLCQSYNRTSFRETDRSSVGSHCSLEA